jgi:dsRNA-specific ribonuclease
MSARSAAYARQHPELPSWRTPAQAGHEFGVLRDCAEALLAALAAQQLVRRQWIYRTWYYHVDDIAVIAATFWYARQFYAERRYGRAPGRTGHHYP